MAKPKPEPATKLHVLPMALKIGDRFTDERGEWRVIDQPYTTESGTDAHIRAERVMQPGVTEVHLWGAHERVTVKRTEERAVSLDAVKTLAERYLIEGGNKHGLIAWLQETLRVLETQTDADLRKKEDA